MAVCLALAAVLAGAPEARCASGTPVFLVATRKVIDPLFQESVVLMLPIAQRPLVAGVIINKPIKVRVRDLFRKIPAIKEHTETAYFGGPVEVDTVSLFMRSSHPSAKASRLFDDVYMSTDGDSIVDILGHSGDAKDVRTFVGRAQWSEEQLHAEMLEGSWYVVPAKAETLFSPEPGKIWRALIQRAELQEADAAPGPVPAYFRLMPGEIRAAAGLDGLSW